MFSRSTTNINKEKQKSYEKFKVDASLYKVCGNLKKIESGSYSVIYPVKDKIGKIYAAKVLKKINGDELEKLFKQEIPNLLDSQNPAVIKFRGYSDKDINGEYNYVLFMDFAKNGSLADYIEEKRPDVNYENNTAYQIILIGIVYAMMYIHKKQIIHFDLKPGNILLDDNFYPLITDFGISERIEPGKKIATFLGTPMYMAPEVADPQSDDISDFEKADVYSFGILMFELLTKTCPYPELKNKKNGILIDPKKRPTFTVDVKESLKNIIIQCWNQDPSKRPTFEELFMKLSGKFDEEEGTGYSQYFLDNVDVEEIKNYINFITKKSGEGKKPIDFSPGRTFYDVRRKAKAPLIVDDDDEEGGDGFDKLKKFNEEEDKNEEMAKYIRLIEFDNERLKMMNAALNEDYSAFQKKNENDIALFQKEIDDLKEQIIEFELNKRRYEKMNQINDLEVEIEELRNKNKELETENQQLTETIDQKTNQIKELEDANQRLNIEKEEATNRIRELEDEKSTLKEKKVEFAALDIDKDSSKFENEDNLFRINELVEENQKLMNEKELLQTKMADYARENRILNQKVEKMGDEFENISKENECLKQKTKKTRTVVKDMSLKNETPKRSIESSGQNSYKQVFKYGFNSLNIGSQQTFISEILKKSAYDRMYPFLTNINRLLLYFMNFRESESATNYLNILIEPNSDEQKTKINELNQVHLLFPATEALYNNNSLNSAEFADILSNFSSVTIQLRYPHEDFREIYNLVISELKNSKIEIFFSGVEETDFAFKKDEIVNSLKFDTSVFTIKGLEYGGSFYCCRSLQKVDIPSSVTSIGAYAFAECSSLKEIVIPSSVKTIGSHAFAGCTSLISAKIPNYVTSIEQSAFSNCDSLVFVSISTQMKMIEEKTFFGCKSLQKVIIPATIISIGEEAFANCSSLARIHFYSPNLLNEGKKLRICKCAFENCSNLEKIKFPFHLELIDSGAFEKCESLIAITIRSDGLSLGADAFRDSPIIEVTMPKSFKKKFKRKELGIPKNPVFYLK